MTKRLLAGLIIAGVSASAGALVTYSAMPRIPRPVAACEVRTFDHLGFFKALDSEKESTSQQLASLAPSSDPLDQQKVEYFEAKQRSLQLLGPLVERQIRTGGSTYACVDPGYRFLMYDLDYPTFDALSRGEDVDRLWKQVAPLVERPWWVTVTQGAGGHVVTAFVALLGIWLVDRRERRKTEQRVVVADKLP